jgi:3',5'-cyclic AMP phosphodiesterase CpdA
MKNEEKHNGGGISRREFIAGAAALGAAGMMGAFDSALAAMAPVPDGVLPEVPTIFPANKGRFRILAVTDLHFHLNHLVDMQTVKEVGEMVAKFEPDIVIPTGDVWHENPEGRGLEYCRYSCEQFAKMKKPWAYVWGNHDKADDYDKAHRMIRNAPYSLYRGDAADGNYRMRVAASGGGPVLWNLIILNDSRGGMRQEQIDWFNAEAAAIRDESLAPPPAFAFFHIPISQYDDLAKSGNAVGVKREAVCHEGGSRDALGAFRDSGFIKAVFCGHDHLNDYYGEMEGIRLQYVRSTGYEGAEDILVPKGGTVIDMNLETGAFRASTVFANGKTWAPKKLTTG